MAEKVKGRMEKVNPLDLKPNAFQREKLTSAQEAVARQVWECIKDAGLFHAFEEFEAGFLRDMHPDRELGVWLWVAQQYNVYVTKHPKADRKAILMEFILYTTKTKEDREAIRKRMGFEDEAG